MSEKVAIIGAGGTGRGFLPRLLQRDGAEICFIDRSGELISDLKSRGEYVIKVGAQGTPVRVSDYAAVCITDDEASERAALADWIFISVGEENLKNLTAFLCSARSKRAEPMRIICCENGIAPKNVLRAALKGTAAEDSLVTQGVIFCTSIPAPADPLNIISEDYPQLPYDLDEDLFELPFSAFPPAKQFTKLLQRKIYTYNCLSACIAYLGAYLGYQVYADAANDKVVQSFCEHLSTGLNKALCKSMDLDADDQLAFYQRALAKFRNPCISDTIQKNARSVIRKLSPTERIIGPLELVKKQGEDASVLLIVAAAALLYLVRNESLSYRGREYEDAVALLHDLDPQLTGNELETIRWTYEKMRAGAPLSSF